MVLDTSVVAKWFVLEDGSDKARELRLLIAEGEFEAVAPDLIYYELGNLLSRQPAVEPGEVAEALAGIEELRLKIVAPAKDVLRAAAVVVRACGVTFYDAVFVALAQVTEDILVSADAKLVHKTTSLSIVRLLDEV